jgi:hypothetical protein
METAGALAPVQYDVVRPYDADLARIPALPARGLLLTDIQLRARAR